LNIANQRLATNKDSQTAIQMLEQADAILLELSYPELTPVRRQISEDLTALRLVQRIDTEGLYFELDALSGQMKDLVQFSPEYVPQSELEESETDSWYQKFWDVLAHSLARFVRVQTSAGEPEYLVSDEQAALSRLSIQLQLRHAQLAMLSGEQSVYEGALVSAAAELTQYYENNDKASVISQRLEELSSMSVSAQEMNVHDSIRALSLVVDQLSRAGTLVSPE